MFPGCEPSEFKCFLGANQRGFKDKIRGQGSVQSEMYNLDLGECIGEKRPKTGKPNSVAKNNEGLN